MIYCDDLERVDDHSSGGRSNTQTPPHTGEHNRTIVANKYVPLSKNTPYDQQDNDDRHNNVVHYKMFATEFYQSIITCGGWMGLNVCMSIFRSKVKNVHSCMMQLVCMNGWRDNVFLLDLRRFPLRYTLHSSMFIQFYFICLLYILMMLMFLTHIYRIS